MGRSWTFGQKLGLGFAVTVALAVATGAVSVLSLRSVVASKDQLIATNAQNLIDAQRLHAVSERRTSAIRAFLLTKEDRFLDQMGAALREETEIVDGLRSKGSSEKSRKSAGEIQLARKAHQDAADRVIQKRKIDPTAEASAKLLDDEVLPRRHELDKHVNDLISEEQRLLEEGRRTSTETSDSAVTLVITIVIAATLFAAGVAFFLTRTLGFQIGSAIQHVQSSSSELQAAANQQATGAKEQATAMNEITTTISELLATSRQIAESARRVAQMAEQTAQAARTGDATVVKGQEVIGGIKRQVDLIVNHMLDLGRKAQQIGGILEIINELAEQTNILAINATIEAAGAGEAGKRFAVVADEIRKLADRVGASTKEIRGLIDETRAAVNTTVMATESGSKSVDLGTRQFSDVAAAFKQISDQVKTTTEAAREIELSTKQQSTAVEQVNAAIADVAQTTKETEASSNQTFQTATQLTTLSSDLSRFVQPRTNA